MDKEITKSGKKSVFVAILGKPNVGKSSLLNSLLGQKLAIVSHKAQTTRNRILGIVTRGNIQFVFIDTPGIHIPKNKLGEYMLKSANQAIKGVDVALFMINPSQKLSEKETALINQINALKLPIIFVINKIDLIKNKNLLIEQMKYLSENYKFSTILPISAKKQDGLENIFKELELFSKSGGFFYEEDALTDQTERSIVAEIIREKILNLLDEEIPHGIAVVIEKMKQREIKGIIDIEATIVCEKESHKAIIIGKNGIMLKQVGSESRLDIEKFLSSKVNLKLWIKVKKDWRNKLVQLKNFGFDKNNL